MAIHEATNSHPTQLDLTPGGLTFKKKKWSENYFVLSVLDDKRKKKYHRPTSLTEIKKKNESKNGMVTILKVTILIKLETI